MSEPIAEAAVYRMLAKIAHPEIRNKNLVEFGMIAGVRVDGKEVHVTVALPYEKIPIRDELIRRVRQEVGTSVPDLEVAVDTTVMDPSQRKAFVAQVRQEQSGPPTEIDRVLAVMSGKGGVGKSSVTGLLASNLRRRGLGVGVLDADVTGPSIPKIFGTVETPMAGPDGPMPVLSASGIKLISVNLLLPEESQAVIWRGPIISKVIEQFWREFAWGKLDYLVVDLPPGTSDAALTVMQSLPLDGIVLVTSPQELAGMVVRKAADMARQVGVPLLGLLENMSYLICPDCQTRIEVYGPSRAAETARLAELPFLGSLPIDPRLAVMCDQGKVEEYRLDAFDTIVDEILKLDFSKPGNAPHVGAGAGTFPV